MSSPGPRSLCRWDAWTNRTRDEPSSAPMTISERDTRSADVDRCGLSLRPSHVGSAPGGEGDDLPDFRALGWLAVEALSAVVVAAAVSLTIQLVIGRVAIPRPSYLPTAATALTVAALATALVVLCRLPRAPWRAVAEWSLPAALTTSVQAWALNGTPLYLFGTGGDQYFRMQYLGRYAASAQLADPNYVDVPPFYPASWFWIGGRLAHVLDVPAWVAYKPYAIITMAVAASLAMVLWSAVTSRRCALALAGTTAVLGLAIGAYEPYSWLAVACIPPVAVLALRLAERDALRGSTAPGGATTLLVGVFVGACAATYSLLAGLFVLVLLVIAAFVVLAPRRSGLRQSEDRGRTWTALTQGARLSTVAAIAGALAVPVWLPYILAALRSPSAGNGAARYFPDVAAELPMPMFELSLLGGLSLLGVGWTTVRFARSLTARALAILAASCYLWHVLSTIMVAFHTSLLAFHTDVVLNLALVCAGILGLVDALAWFRNRTSTGLWVGTRAAVSIVAVLAIVSLTQTPPDAMQQLVAGAFSSYDDHGKTALDPAATPRDDEPGSWNEELIATLDRMTGRPPQDVVLLTSDWPILDFEPYWGFQTSIQEYANPLAQYPARRAEIEDWARSSDSQDLLRRLDASAFTAPTAFVLARETDGLHVALSYNQFPRSDTNRYVDAVFPSRLFDGPGFVRRDVGPFTVVVRTSRP